MARRTHSALNPARGADLQGDPKVRQEVGSQNSYQAYMVSHLKHPTVDLPVYYTSHTGDLSIGVDLSVPLNGSAIALSGRSARDRTNVTK